MSNTEDYKTLFDKIDAIDKASLKAPNMPVHEALQEAENLFHWATDDKDELIANGLEVKFLNELPKRAGACREAESLWLKERNSQQDPEKEWDEMSEEADKLRKKLLRAFDYAFRKEESLLKKVSQIRQGSSKANMIQDLNDIAVLGKGNEGLMEKINIDMALFDKSAETADKMAHLLAIINGEKQQDTPEKIFRNKAYTYLKEAVDEIRACGKYVFADNPERLKGYISNYFKKKRKKNTHNDVE